MRFLKFLGHLWALILNLFALVVVLAAFSVAASKFEVVVVAGITLLYVTLVTGITNQVRFQLESLQATAGLLVRILRDLKDTKATDEERGLREAREAYERQNVRYYINVAFLALLWLVATWELVTTVLS
jgi:hypothetical protein